MASREEGCDYLDSRTMNASDYKKQIRDLTAQRDAAVALLRELEWSKSSSGNNIGCGSLCPVCGGVAPGHQYWRGGRWSPYVRAVGVGHKGGCKLAAILKQVGGE